MGKFYLMQKGKTLTHTYSENVKQELEEKKWKHVATISGWNCGISYITKNIGDKK